MTEEVSDEELMAQVAQGNQRAFRGLAERHRPRIFRLAYRLTQNRADAEEIAQEALLRVWVNAPGWRPTARFRTWLYRVVVNLTVDWQRRGKRRAPFAAPLDQADVVADPGPDPAHRLSRDETGRLVAEAIAALPERQRTALVLVHTEGLSNVEAAAVLGTSVGGIEGLLVRARRTLRDRLAPLLKD